MDQKLKQGASAAASIRRNPGEPVPTVDPDDAKTVWQVINDANVMHPGKNVVGIEVMRRACRPGTNIEAVVERLGFLWMMSHIAPEDPRFTRDRQPDEALFRATAMVPAVWMGVGIVQQGPSFDVKQFLRLCEEGNPIA